MSVLIQFRQLAMSELKAIKQQGLFLEIESRYLEGAGIFVRPGINYIFVRKEVVSLFASLETVLDQGRICNVIGPPGTGKSLAAYSFACMILDRGFIITWIHLYNRQEHKYVRFADGQKTQGVLDGIEEFESFLAASTIGQNHLLILDGVTPDHRVIGMQINGRTNGYEKIFPIVDLSMSPLWLLE